MFLTALIYTNDENVAFTFAFQELPGPSTETVVTCVFDSLRRSSVVDDAGSAGFVVGGRWDVACRPGTSDVGIH